MASSPSTTSPEPRVEEDDLPLHLERADISAFEVERRRKGKGWCYVYRDGRPVKDKRLLEQLSAIPVPATWTEVQLCLNPRAHILATGYDGSGKHQYLYHADYLEYRNERKFSELLRFGLALPRIRRQIKRDLAVSGWNERKLLALLVKILDKYHLRVGSRVYARRNQSFGLTTLRKKHLKEVDDELAFEYQGKAGQQQSVVLADPQLVALMREVAEFPGWELFSIRSGGQRLRADAAAINGYIQEISQSDFTARSFRTWAGTVLAVKHYQAARRIVAAQPRRELGAVLTELVAAELGNTPAICRAYYIHPAVLDKVLAGDFNPDPCDPAFLRKTQYRRYECRTLEILTRLEEEEGSAQRPSLA